MRISLTREEAMACIIALERMRPLGEWGKSALSKLLLIMGLKEGTNG